MARIALALPPITSFEYRDGPKYNYFTLNSSKAPSQYSF